MNDQRQITPGKSILIALCVLVALVLIVTAGAYLLTPVIFSDFYGDAVAEYPIPGLKDGLVPQGYTYLPEQNVFLACGYMADGSASRIYITPADDPAATRYISLITMDGKPYTGHTGGLAAAGDRLWLVNNEESGENCVWVLTLEDVLTAENGSDFMLGVYFNTEVRAAYCYADEDYLWLGEFYRAENYHTSDTHTFQVSGDTTHHAIICAYPIDERAVIGIRSESPEWILSVTDRVQGMARTENGNVILSTSYGLSQSHLLIYQDVISGIPDATLELDGISVPVYYLNQSALVRDIAGPPMCEEIAIRDGRLYVLLESASEKYLFGNLLRSRHIYSIPIE